MEKNMIVLNTVAFVCIDIMVIALTLCAAFMGIWFTLNIVAGSNTPETKWTIK
jgi:hypothetical protein